MVAAKVSPKRRRWGALGVAVVLVAAAAAAMLSTAPVMTARITLSADGEDPVTVYDGGTSFRDSDAQLLAHWLLEQRRTRAHLAAAPTPTPEISDELRDQLRGLGYMR